jgi:uncharacterized protein (TIGR03086 family)
VRVRLDPAEEHRYVAARFAEVANGAAPADWAAPSPVASWTARDVVGHLIEWLPGFLGRDLPAVDLTDPAAAWRRRAADVQALIETVGDEVMRNRHIGELTVADALHRFYTPDIFMHTWDLARALGQEPDLDEARAAQLLAESEPYEEVMRASGQYGPPVAVPADASAQDRLVAFIGRDPAWQRPASSSSSRSS